MNSTALDRFVAKALELRNAADEAQEAFLDFLYTSSKDPDICDGSGYTFVEILERYNICKVSRFLKYAEMRDAHADAVKGVGVFAVEAAAALKEPDAQREVIDEAKQWEATNKTSISEQSARRIVRDVRMRRAGTRAKHRTYNELLAENDRLKRELAEARADAKRWRTECERLRADLKKVRGTGRGARS